MDIAVFIEEHNPKLLKLFLGGATSFRVSRKLGRVGVNCSVDELFR